MDTVRSVTLGVITAACLAAAAAQAQDAAATTVVLSGRPALLGTLLDMALAALRPAGMSLDKAKARLLLPPELEADGALENVEVRISAIALPQPSMPMSFDLTFSGDDRPRTARAILAAPVLREVLLAKRRIGKRDELSCNDAEAAWVDARHVPRAETMKDCAAIAGLTALRDIGRGDVLRSIDLGIAPPVMAGDDVRVLVQASGISVETRGLALNDGLVGSEISVRLRSPLRTTLAQVASSGTVNLAEVRP